MVNATAIFWVSGGKSNREEISSGVAPEPRRRQELTFSSDGGHHSTITKPKSTLPNHPESLGPASHFTPSSSFPKYVDTDLERSANGDLLTRPSWISRLFSKEKPRKERHLKVSFLGFYICHRRLHMSLLQITVTKEYGLETSQIELQRRPDSNSEIDHDIASPPVP